MKQFDRLTFIKKFQPKKETINFILAFSRSYTSLTSPDGKKYFVYKN